PAYLIAMDAITQKNVSALVACARRSSVDGGKGISIGNILREKMTFVSGGRCASVDWSGIHDQLKPARWHRIRDHLSLDERGLANPPVEHDTLIQKCQQRVVLDGDVKIEVAPGIFDAAPV
ncbi:MAG: hypothetical protein WKF63_02570, partial [Thermomicrobiales bacterium]